MYIYKEIRNGYIIRSHCHVIKTLSYLYPCIIPYSVNLTNRTYCHCLTLWSKQIHSHRFVRVTTGTKTPNSSIISSSIIIIKRKCVCFEWIWKIFRIDTILTFSLALRSHENIQLYHFSMRYIPYPLKTNTHPLYTKHSDCVSVEVSLN